MRTVSDGYDQISDQGRLPRMRKNRSGRGDDGGGTPHARAADRIPRLNRRRFAKVNLYDLQNLCP